MKVERKTFLRAAWGAMLATAGFVYSDVGASRGSTVADTRLEPLGAIATPQADVRRMEKPDPTYAGGEVVEKTPDGVILRSAEGMRTVRIPANAVVWKEFEVTPDAIQLHDWLDVQGTPLEDGILLAQSGAIFANIGRRDGVVERVSTNHLVLKHNQGTETIELSFQLEIVSAATGAPVAEGVGALKPGTPIGAVGLRLPDGGFRATKIWTR